MSTRLLASVGVLVTAVGLAILAWPQFFGMARAPITAQVVSLRPLAVIAGLLLVVVFAVLAFRAVGARTLCAAIAVLLIGFCAANVAVLSARGLGDRSGESPEVSGVTILSWNTLGGAPGATEIARLAIDSDAEIVSLPETTAEIGDAIGVLMQEAGRPMTVLTLAYDQESTAHSTTLLVSKSLGDYTFDTSAQTTQVLPTVLATPRDGNGPTILAVHTLAPIPPMMLAWQDDLVWVAAACSGSNVIVAGDFNATLDHFSGLATSAGSTIGNCADAGLATGNGAVGTWPTALPALLGAPIDHVMFTPNWHVTGMRVVQNEDGAGSDHRPVIVQLSPSS